VCCLALSAAFIGPRFAFVLVWIFGNKVEQVYSSWIWPLLGVLFFPWTSLAYIIVWGPVDHVSGSGWILVAIGVFLDLASWAGRAAKSAYDTARA
jgi:hypothetical protein